MTPENLVINDGFRTIRIDVYNEHLTKNQHVVLLVLNRVHRDGYL